MEAVQTREQSSEPDRVGGDHLQLPERIHVQHAEESLQLTGRRPVIRRKASDPHGRFPTEDVQTTHGHT